MKHILTFSMLFLLFTSVVGQESALIMTPEHPKPGDDINLTYDQSSTVLAEADGIHAIGYSINGGEVIAHDITLRKEGSVWKGTFPTNSDTKVAGFIFKDAHLEKSDDNDGVGYYTTMQMEGSKKSLPGVYATLANLYGGTWEFKIEPNEEKAVKLIKKEFEMHPESRNNMDYAQIYMYAMRSEDNDASKAALVEMADDLSKSKADEEMYMAYQMYNTAEDEAKAEKLAKKMNKKFPNGKYARNQARSAMFKRDNTVEQVVDGYNNYVAMLDTDDPEDAKEITYVSAIAFYFLTNQDAYETANNYLDDAVGYGSLNYMLADVSKRLAGEDLENDAVNLEMASFYGNKAFKMAKTALHEGNLDGKSEYQSEKEYLKSLGNTLGYVASSTSLVSYKEGNYEKALARQEMAKQYIDDPDLDWYQSHAAYYAKLHSPEEVEALLSDYVRAGKATDEMKADYRNLFMENNTLATAFDKHMMLLEEEANARYWEEVKTKMIDMEAPAFELTNLDGEVVSLQDMKGKTVVLDFWATWCGPCKKSFPAMKDAQAKYASNGDVVFLFVNSWENGDNVEEKVAKFIADNEYPFNVPMDGDDAVIKSYKVDGIPTKFVIDPNGKIRFKSVGFSGSDAQLVKELGTMIELAAEAGTADKGV